jgi:ribosomal 30S subunit maturation factor RimM
VMVPAALIPILSYSVRGGIKVKPDGGKVTVRVDPGKASHVLFLKSGQPWAIGVIKSVTRSMGDWVVEYAGVKWLTDKKPEE